jgi:hypothetical protein
MNDLPTLELKMLIGTQLLQPRWERLVAAIDRESSLPSQLQRPYFGAPDSYYGVGVPVSSGTALGVGVNVTTAAT